MIEHSRDKLAHHSEYLRARHFVCVKRRHSTEVVKEMIKSPNHRVLVINKLKMLVGIISPKDILLVRRWRQTEP